MNLTTGTEHRGPCGVATQVLATLEPADPPDLQGTVGTWFLDCPGQSPAWRHYVLACIHLRPIEGVKPAVIRVPRATHEVFLYALDRDADPTPTDATSWRRLTPINVMEQIELPDDGAAAHLLERCAQAVVAGVLPAEPPLAGAREPWLSVLLKTAAHQRGEEHAP